MHLSTRLAALIWAITLAHPALLSAQAESRPSILTTTGSASRSVRPDLASFTISFTAEGRSPLEAGKAVALKADSLRRAFQTLGIPRDSLLSGNRWYWWRGRVERILGPEKYERMPPGVSGPTPYTRDTTFRASDAIQLRIRDLSKVGQTFDSAMAHGILEYSELSFTATNTTAEDSDVLREATIAARRKADTMAAAAGARLGRLLSLSTQPPPERYGYFEDVSVTSAGVDAAQGTQVILPLVRVATTVYATWELITR